MTHALDLFQTQLSTPLGRLCIVTDRDAVVRALDWLDFESRMRRLLELHYGDSIGLTSRRGPSEVSRAIEAYFSGEIRALAALPVATGGSPFQRDVWRALRRIAPGTTVSYGELAARIGRPRAVRAVGLANGQNPIGLIVPCHRVIGANGALTGYAGGLDRKRWLLQHEGVQLRGADSADARRVPSGPSQWREPRVQDQDARP